MHRRYADQCLRGAPLRMRSSGRIDVDDDDIEAIVEELFLEGASDSDGQEPSRGASVCFCLSSAQAVPAP